MRVNKEFVEILSKKIVKSLLEKDLIIWEEAPDKLENIISGIIIEDVHLSRSGAPSSSIEEPPDISIMLSSPLGVSTCVS